MGKMTVTPRSAQKCCAGCEAEYGKSNKGVLKDKFRRQLKRRERAAWKREANA